MWFHVWIWAGTFQEKNPWETFFRKMVGFSFYRSSPAKSWLGNSVDYFFFYSMKFALSLPTDTPPPTPIKWKPSLILAIHRPATSKLPKLTGIQQKQKNRTLRKMLGKRCVCCFPWFFLGGFKSWKKHWVCFFAFCIHAINQYLRKTKNYFFIAFETISEALMFTEVNVCT